MAVDVTKDRSRFSDVIRIPIETRLDGELKNPKWIESFELVGSEGRAFILRDKPWIQNSGGLILQHLTDRQEPIEGSFYIDMNPYRHGIRQAGSYMAKWVYHYENRIETGSLPIYLEESSEILPKELDEDLHPNDLVRVRFSIRDKHGTPIDPEYINRMVIYRTPPGPNLESIDTKILFILRRENLAEHIWTRSRFLSGESQYLTRESQGEFYFDWDTRGRSGPGKCLAILFYRNPLGISPMRGNSWELQGVDIYFLNNQRARRLDKELFEKMYDKWIPTVYKDLPQVQDYGGDGETIPSRYDAVSSRLLKGFGKAAKDFFDWAIEFEDLYDPDRVAPQALPSLASNVGWNIKGPDPDLWRGQVYRSIELLGKKGTLEGLKGFIEVMGGRLESLTRYWQVTSKNIQRDYFRVDTELQSFNRFHLSKPAFLYDSDDPYKFLKILRRKVVLSNSHNSWARVNRGSFVVRIQNIISEEIHIGDRIWIKDQLGFEHWLSISKVEIDRDESTMKISLNKRFLGATTHRGSFLIGRAGYEELDPQRSLILDINNLSVRQVRWNIDTMGYLHERDDIIIEYQTRPLTEEEANLEIEIMGLPLADPREEREVSFPPKNFNSRLLEDPDGYWSLGIPETKEGFTLLDGPLNANEPIKIQENTVLTNNSLLYPYPPFPPLDSEENQELQGRLFVSVHGTFFYKANMYGFIVIDRGGYLGTQAFLYIKEEDSENYRVITAEEFDKASSGENDIFPLKSILLSEHFMEIRTDPLTVDPIHYLKINYLYLTKDTTSFSKDYLQRRRDRICPFGIEEHDLTIFGFERTIFPYSEKVYNMDEYNGGLRPSYNPCYIGLDFVDLCHCTPTTWISLALRVPDLSDKTIEEFREGIIESKPFHAQIHSLSFVGDLDDSIIFSEQLEILIKIGLEDHIFWVQNQLRSRDSHFRSQSSTRDRSESLYLRKIFHGDLQPSLTRTILFSHHQSVDLTGLEDYLSILSITVDEIERYFHFKKTPYGLEILDFDEEINIEGLLKFSTYTPICSVNSFPYGFGEYSIAVYGISPYGDIIFDAFLQGSEESRSNFLFSNVKLMKDFGVEVGNYIKISDLGFFRILRINEDITTDGTELVVEGTFETNQYAISIWRNVHREEWGEIDRQYSTFTTDNLGEVNPSVRYLASVESSSHLFMGERIRTPIVSAQRIALQRAPVDTRNNFYTDPSGSIHQQDYINDELSHGGWPADIHFCAYGFFWSLGSKYEFILFEDGSHLLSDDLPGMETLKIEEGGLFVEAPGLDLSNFKIWYNHFEGEFHPIENLNPGEDLTTFTLLGFQGFPSESVDMGIYEMIPTGKLYNPRGYTGSLLPPYSSCGRLSKDGVEYSFVTKAEGGRVGSMSDITPEGHDVTSIKFENGGIVVEPPDYEVLGVEIAEGTDRSHTDDSMLFVKMIEDYPYFVHVMERNSLINNFSTIPPQIKSQYYGGARGEIKIDPPPKRGQRSDEMFWAEKLEVHVYHITDPESYQTWIDNPTAENHNWMVLGQTLESKRLVE